jgi:chromosomal replication initiator protein
MELSFGRTQTQIVRRTVANYFEVSEAALYSKSRKQPLTDARHIAMYLVYRLVPSMTLETIARHFGRTDHTTTMHAIRKVEARIETAPDVRHDVFSLWNIIETNSKAT